MSDRHVERGPQCFACGQSLYEPPELVRDIEPLTEFGQSNLERLASRKASEVDAQVGDFARYRAYASYAIQAVYVGSAILAFIAAIMLILDAATLTFNQRTGQAVILYGVGMIVTKWVAEALEPEVLKV